MSKQLGNVITIDGQDSVSFYRHKYLTFEEVMCYTSASKELMVQLLNEYEVLPVRLQGEEKYLKSEIDEMMFSYVSE